MRTRLLCRIHVSCDPTRGLAYDVEAIAKGGLLAPDWQKRLPENATPYRTKINLTVRAAAGHAVPVARRDRGR